MHPFIMIDIVGGPCGGKTKVKQYLEERYSDRIVFVPEGATALLSSCFPRPGVHCKWSEQWQELFERALYPLQLSLEAAWQLVAKERGIRVVACDRGTLDAASYLPGGVEQFCGIFGITPEAEFCRYEMIIHLESLATADPEKYGSLDNDVRFESLERAQMLERQTWKAWLGHPNHHFITGKQSIEDKCRQAEELILRYLDIPLAEQAFRLQPALHDVYHQPA